MNSQRLSFFDASAFFYDPTPTVLDGDEGMFPSTLQPEGQSNAGQQTAPQPQPMFSFGQPPPPLQVAKEPEFDPEAQTYYMQMFDKKMRVSNGRLQAMLDHARKDPGAVLKVLSANNCKKIARSARKFEGHRELAEKIITAVIDEFKKNQERYMPAMQFAELSRQIGLRDKSTILSIFSIMEQHLCEVQPDVRLDVDLCLQASEVPAFLEAKNSADYTMLSKFMPVVFYDKMDPALCDVCVDLVCARKNYGSPRSGFPFRKELLSAANKLAPQSKLCFFVTKLVQRSYAEILRKARNITSELRKANENHFAGIVPFLEAETKHVKQLSERLKQCGSRESYEYRRLYYGTVNTVRGSDCFFGSIDNAHNIAENLRKVLDNTAKRYAKVQAVLSAEETAYKKILGAPRNAYFSICYTLARLKFPQLCVDLVACYRVPFFEKCMTLSERSEIFNRAKSYADAHVEGKHLAKSSQPKRKHDDGLQYEGAHTSSTSSHAAKMSRQDSSDESDSDDDKDDKIVSDSESENE